jgi:hypothetical protein
VAFDGFYPQNTKQSTGYLLRPPQLFTSGTTISFAPGTRFIVLEMWGNGGGGGGATGTSTSSAAGAGGGSGGYLLAIVTLPTAFVMNFGAVGAAGSSAGGAGGNGGNITFSDGTTTYTVRGGNGGAGQLGGTTAGGAQGGAAAAVSTGGLLNLPGCNGESSWRSGDTNCRAGAGGRARLGSGGLAFVGSQNVGGDVASGFGAGGSGALISLSNATVGGPGAAGNPGAIRIWEYGDSPLAIPGLLFDGVTFHSSDTTLNLNAGCELAVIEAWGAGGGGGGGAFAASNCGIGTGGASGAHGVHRLYRPTTKSLTITIGQGGAGGLGDASTNGGFGTNTTVVNGATTYTFRGGNGGLSQAAGNTQTWTSGALGSTVTNAEWNHDGEPGGWAHRRSGSVGGTQVGQGKSRFGRGGPGSGGLGGNSAVAGVNAAGTAGKNGIVIVWQWRRAPRRQHRPHPKNASLPRGLFLGIQVLTSGTSGILPAGTRSVFAEMVGAGSNASGATSAGASSTDAALGGEAGAYACKYFSRLTSGTFTYAIGLNAVTGGNTTLTMGGITVTAPGGPPSNSTGAGSTLQYLQPAGISTSTNGDINGQTGPSGVALRNGAVTGFAGDGGDCVFGGGGQGIMCTSNDTPSGSGGAGTGFGSGGGGSLAFAGASFAGAVGADGVIVLFCWS